MNAVEQINAYKELRQNGQAFFVDNYADADRIIEALEKQIPKKVFANTRNEFTNEDFKGFSATRYYCPNCKKPIKGASLFCDKCGQKVLFPTFSWSPYIEGEVQTRTMIWEQMKGDNQHNTSDFNIAFHMKQVIATSMLTVFLIPENKKRMEELVGIELNPFELKEVMIGNLFSDIVNEYLSKPMGIDEEAYQ